MRRNPRFLAENGFAFQNNTEASDDGRKNVEKVGERLHSMQHYIYMYRLREMKRENSEDSFCILYIIIRNISTLVFLF